MRYAGTERDSYDAREERWNELQGKMLLTTTEAADYMKLADEFQTHQSRNGNPAHVRSSADSERIRSAYQTRAGEPDCENPRLVLRSNDSYATWLANQPGARSAPHDFDSAKYWRGMATGNWSGAAAEQRASMQEGVNADGGYLVPSPVAGEWVDILRNKVIFMAGAGNVVPWQSGSTLSLPVITADPLVENLAETVDVYPPSSDATVSRYEFIARPYESVETISWELLQDSAIDIADVVQTAMAARMAQNIQTDFIYNSSSATKVQGFTAASGLLTGVEGGGSNGAAPTSAHGYDYVDMAIEQVRNAKVEADLIATSPKAYQTYGRLKNTLNDAIRPSPTVQSFLNGQDGKQFATTTAISDTQTVGTTSGCSDLFVMDSSRIYWAIRSDFSVLPLKERFATQRLAGLLAWLRIDAVLTHPEAAYWLQGIVSS